MKRKHLKTTIKQERDTRNALIVKRFKELHTKGSQLTPVYELVHSEFPLCSYSTVAKVCSKYYKSTK